MRSATALILTLAAMGNAWGQATQPRDPVQVDTSTVGNALDLAVANGGNLSNPAGNLSAIAYVDDATQKVYLVASDGRGSTKNSSWFAPVAIDGDAGNPPDPKQTQRDSIDVTGNDNAGYRVYVAWTQTPASGDREIRLRVASGTGPSSVSLGSVVTVPKLSGTTDVTAWRLVVAEGAVSGTSQAADTLYFLVAGETAGAGNPSRLYLVRSTNSGASFGSPVPASQFGGTQPDVSAISLDAEASNVFAAWIDDRNGGTCEPFFQRSTNGGSSWLGSDTPVTQSPGSTGDAEPPILVRVDDARVAVSWQENRTSSNEELRMNVSTNMGSSFLNNDVLVGSYTPGTDKVQDHDMVVLGERILFTWSDDRCGNEVFASTTADDGGSFFPAGDQQLSNNDGLSPCFSEPCKQPPYWVQGVSFLEGSNPNAEAAFTDDRGSTWNTDFSVSDFTNSKENKTFTTGNVSSVEPTFNRLYRNLIYTWLDDQGGSTRVYAGGYKPHTTCPDLSGDSGLVTLKFDHNFFDPNGDDFVFVLLSFGPGPFPLPDGRLLDLTFDALFTTSLVNSALFLTTTSGGSGSTMPFVVTAPSGTTVHFAAIGFRVLPVLLLDSVTDSFTFSVP